MPQHEVMVKQEEKIGGNEKKYPLAGLENSYPIIDFMTWNSWLIQKQKRLEFQMKSKDELPSATTFGHDLAFLGKLNMI
jgi:hypothetical protein